jgi:hypothetical protein
LHDLYGGKGRSNSSCSIVDVMETSQNRPADDPAGSGDPGRDGAGEAEERMGSIHGRAVLGAGSIPAYWLAPPRFRIGWTFAALQALLVGRMALPRRAKLPLIWIACAGVLAYLPLGMLVLTRVLYIVSVPFGILGTWGLLATARLVKAPAIRRRVVAYGILLGGMVSVYEFGYSVRTPLLHLNSRASYISRDMRSALNELETRPPGLTMNVYLSGILVPPYSGHGTYIGDLNQTLNLADTERNALAFYEMDNSARADFMRQHGLRYALFGPEERGVTEASGRPITDGAFFRLLIRHGDVQVFEVR